ncbi:hypothetical protein [Georgenia faecalis]|uniref:Uncharacterized protein n=1 Tax=Georgenia faecalis TaxID=2483799 RepID=A0ABV9D9X8_9MICO|nr:hypothetical protein [Georgenia faecalis]
MTAMGEAMNRIVPNLVRLARKPGQVLLVAAAVPVAAFAVLTTIFGTGATSWTGWLPLVAALVLAVPVALLAWRRERLQRTTASLDPHPTIVEGGGEIVVIDVTTAVDPRRAQLESELGALSEAYAEGQVRTARWLPRVEAAQRSLLRAAGGTVNAPYLKDDLRVTLLAFVGTVAAIPLGVLGTFVTAFALLLR